MSTIYLLFYKVQNESDSVWDLQDSGCEAFISPYDRFERIKQLKEYVDPINKDRIRFEYYLRDLEPTLSENILQSCEPWDIDNFNDTMLNIDGEECVDEFDGEPAVFTPYEPS